MKFKSGEALTRTSATGSTWKRMLFVIKQSTWERAFLAYSISTFSTAHTGRAFYWYSISSSEWNLITLWSRDWALKQYWGVVWASQSNADSLQPDTISQVLSNVSWSVWINISTSNPPYPWVTYTIVVSSVSAAYDVDLWTWVTNPVWIPLPTNSTKKCVITVMPTSTTTAIITGCTIEP